MEESKKDEFMETIIENTPDDSVSPEPEEKKEENSLEPENETQGKNIKKEILEWVIDIGVAVAIAAVILTFFKPIIIQQDSMLPNFESGDYIVASRQAYSLFGEVKRGDVIIFRSELEDEKGKQKNLIKRIIGIPGDVIQIKDDGYVYVNGEKIDEPYVREEGISDQLAGLVEETVPEGYVFCMGDNREVSIDSRMLGCIDQEEIVGKVVVRLFPLKSKHTGF